MSHRSPIPAVVLFTLARGLPRAQARGMNLKFVALGFFFRAALSCLKPRHLQRLAPSTTERYKGWLLKKKKELSTTDPEITKHLRQDIELIPGTEAFIAWIGDRNKASKFVLFLHGGGYMLPAIDGHFEWAWNAYVAGGPGKKSEVAVAMIQYTLCPQATYPEQLRQACAGLGMLLERGISPSDILFGGDSAGGNLAVQLIRHLVQPHPGIQPIMLKEPIAGAFMVSPLVDGRPDTRSFQDNDSVDMISSSLCLQACNEIFRPRPGDMSVEEIRGLALPMEGDPEWMTRIQSVVRALYVTGGKQEGFADHIRQFAELVRRQCPGLDIRLEMAQHEAHDYIILEGILGGSFDATRRMQAWASGAM